MNDTRPPRHYPAEREALETRYALRVTARLSEYEDALSPDVAERLRVARESALARARTRGAVVKEQVALATSNGSGTLHLRGAPDEGWWWWSMLPVLVLLAGLLLVQEWHTRSRVAAATEVDMQLLTDDLPPGAYRDPGFSEFLKTTPRD